jgi:hypothetical protein
MFRAYARAGRIRRTSCCQYFVGVERTRCTNTAAGAPTSTPTLAGLGRSPFPRPLKLHRRASACGVVSNQLNLGVLVEIGVGLKLPCHQVVQVLRTRGKDEGQAVYDGID